MHLYVSLLRNRFKKLCRWPPAGAESSPPLGFFILCPACEVTCIKGALIPDVSTCLAACNVNDVATQLALGVDSETFNVPLTTLIAHGGAGSESCTQAHAGFDGSVALSCNNGVLTMSSNTCVEKGCPQDRRGAIPDESLAFLLPS